MKRLLGLKVPYYKNRLNARIVSTAISVMAFTVIGFWLLSGAGAATFVASGEAETGIKTGSATVVSDANASNGQAVRFEAGSGGGGCTISAILVPSCGAWLGVWSQNHGVSGFRAQIEEHESRIGRKVHVAHSYKSQGGTLNADEKYFINRSNTYMFTNWKPASNWENGSGGNATVNADIDKMADSIKGVSPKKIFLTVWHEPENDVSGGAEGCASTAYKGSTGTPAQYRAMWANVQSRFAAKGVTNVVWAMTYMGFANWDCMIDDLWPGDNNVDWMIWEPYYGTKELFEEATTKAYNKFTNLSAPGHNFKSKPWGFGEWASWDPSTSPPQPVVYKLYDDAKTSINAGKFPNLKMYIYYDVIGPAHDDRLEYTHNGTPDPVEQQHYNSFANSPIFNHNN